MNDQDDAIVRRSGITRAEFNLLHSVEIVDGLYPSDRLIAHARFLDSAADEDYSVEEYQTALEQCFQKGRLKMLTAEDCERDRARWVQEPDQFISEAEYEAGHVEFTGAGADLYYRILEEMAHARGEEPFHDTLGYAWRFPGQVRIFGVSEERVRNELPNSEQEGCWLYTGKMTIHRIEGPFPVGPWWINRFIRLPTGFRMDIYCTLEDEENYSQPD